MLAFIEFVYQNWFINKYARKEKAKIMEPRSPRVPKGKYVKLKYDVLISSWDHVPGLHTTEKVLFIHLLFIY